MKLWNEKRNYNIFKMKIKIFEIKNKKNEYDEINEKEKNWNKKWKKEWMMKIMIWKKEKNKIKMNEYKIEMIMMIKNKEWKENEEKLDEKLKIKWKIKIIFKIEKKLK